MVLSRFERARDLHRQRQLTEARRLYEQVLRQRPEFAPALHYLGFLEHMEGNSEAGLVLLRRSLELEPDNPDTLKNIANLLTELERPQEAESFVRRLLDINPADASAHGNLSVILRRQGRFADAVLEARRAIELAPELMASWLSLGHAYNHAGQLRRAVRAYQRAVDLEPGFSPAHDSLCRATLALEQRQLIGRRRLRRTQAAYQRWHQDVPDHPTARFMHESFSQGATPERMPDDVVRESFDRFAPNFDRQLERLDYQGPQKVAQVLASRLTSPEGKLEVLDGGCGTGLAGPLLRPYARTLVGVDLSPAMLEQASRRDCYDELVEAELGGFATRHPDRFDLVTLVDCALYFGDLTTLIDSLAQALRPGGLLAFTLEKMEGAQASSGYRLHPTGRYSHSAAYVTRVVEAAGLTQIDCEDAFLRLEYQTQVTALVVSALRPATPTPGDSSH